MSNEPGLPVLSPGNLKRVLDAVRAARPLPATSLSAFEVIHQRLMDPAAVAGDTAADVALLEWLSVEIVEGLDRQRAYHNLSLPDVNASLSQALACLTQDFRQGAPELEAWSLLFFRYVRADLSLNWDQLETATAQDQRTLRRRQERGLQRLAQQIIQREQEARRIAHKSRLRHAVPPLPPYDLVGRSRLLDRAWGVLTSRSERRHLVLTGPGGIGKTTLALHLTHRLIDEVEPDRVIWLAPSPDMSPSHLPMRCAEALGVSSGAEDALRMYCQRWDVLFVLDEAEPLIQAGDAFGRFLDQIAEARLFVTSRLSRHDLPLRIINVPELKEHDAMTLMGRFWPPTRRLTGSQRQKIWAQAGGNPLAVQIVTRLASLSPQFSLAAAMTSPGATLLNDLYDQAWRQLDDPAQCFWLATWLLPSPWVLHDLAMTASGLTPHQGTEAAQRLEQLSLLDFDSAHERYILHSIARAYLQRKVATGPDLAARARQASQRLAQVAVGSPYVAPIACHLLEFADLLALTAEERQRWIGAAWPTVRQQGLWATWRPVLEKQLAVFQGPDHAVARATLLGWLGVICRWLGQMDHAEGYLQQAVQQSGDHGDQHGQAQALAELAVVYRYQRRYEVAQATAQHARAEFRRLQDADGEERCLLELTQLALDQQQPGAALRWLEHVAVSARSCALACDAHLLLSNLLSALTFAEKAVVLAAAERPNHARAQATLGRVYLALGRLYEAEDHLLLALSLLDQGHDTLGWARAAGALARVYQLQGRMEVALSLLEDAVAQQRILNDLNGLAITLQGILSICLPLTEEALATGASERADELAQMMREYDAEWRPLVDADLPGGTESASWLWLEG